MQEDHTEEPVKKSQNARDHLANERTLLAWIRTSIGIMAFGFVVSKFSLFMKQLAFFIGQEMPSQQRADASMLGIILVVTGTMVLVLSFVKYKQTEKQLLDESYQPSTRLILILAIAIFLISIALISYLIENHFNN